MATASHVTTAVAVDATATGTEAGIVRHSAPVVARSRNGIVAIAPGVTDRVAIATVRGAVRAPARTARRARKATPVVASKGHAASNRRASVRRSPCLFAWITPRKFRLQLQVVQTRAHPAAKAGHDHVAVAVAVVAAAAHVVKVDSALPVKAATTRQPRTSACNIARVLRTMAASSLNPAPSRVRSHAMMHRWPRHPLRPRRLMIAPA